MIFYKHGWMNGWITINVHGSCWTRWFHVFPNLRPRHRGPNLGTTTQVGIKNYPSGVSWHGHGRSSSFMENTIKIGGCSIAMLVYWSVGIFGISTKQKNTSKWNVKSPSRLQLFGHESHFSSIEGTYITSITEQNYMWCSCFKKSWGHCSNSSSSQSIAALWTMPGNFPIKETKNNFMDYVWNPIQHPFFNVFIAQVTVHRYNFWTLWKAWPSSPSLGKPSRQRGNK